MSENDRTAPDNGDAPRGQGPEQKDPGHRDPGQKDSGQKDSGQKDPGQPGQATVRRSKFSLIWLVPLVALLVAGYLGFRTIRSEGPRITVSFKTGEGLVAGQTKVRHKAVELGQVETVRLADDMQKVVVGLRMGRDAQPYLTDQTRFWVVRPRLNAGSISGIETLVSGSYIEMDPGTREGGKEKAEFVGLETPPAVRSGEPGRTFKLSAARIGSLGSGAPVFYRDIVVGEVLGYDIGDGSGPVTITLFVRKPYDDFVRAGSHFWNASGLSVQVGTEGIHVEVASLQALVAGGVAFDSPREAPNSGEAKADTEFHLFRNYQEAQAAGYKTRQDFVAYFESSVRGLGRGAAVEFYGLQIGVVTDVGLDFDPGSARARVRVRFEIQPERISKEAAEQADPVETARKLIARGMRAQLKTSSFLTGALVLSLDFVPGAPPAQLQMEGKDMVFPSTSGGIDGILSSVSNIAKKLEAVPFDQIGNNLNETLKGAAGTMGSVQALVQRTDKNLTPVLNRLPALMASIQDTVAGAGRTVSSLGAGYGKDSQFGRELERAMVQVGDTARSIRLLADFLDRHPEALIRGRANTGSTR